MKGGILSEAERERRLPDLRLCSNERVLLHSNRQAVILQLAVRDGGLQQTPACLDCFGAKESPALASRVSFNVSGIHKVCSGCMYKYYYTCTYLVTVHNIASAPQEQEENAHAFLWLTQAICVCIFTPFVLSHFKAEGSF